MKSNPFLWVAFDGLGQPNFPLSPDVLTAMWAVDGRWGPKTNLDTVVEFGAEGAAARLPDDSSRSMKRPRFVDLKTHNGKRTIVRLMPILAKAGFTHVNFHLIDADDLTPVVAAAKEHNLVTMGLTLLSHGDQIDIDRIKEAVKAAESYGVDQVILPAKFAGEVTTHLEILGTGIREKGPDATQPHAIKPWEAVEEVDAVAVGSPITKADDPVAALKQYLAWLGG